MKRKLKVKIKISSFARLNMIWKKLRIRNSVQSRFSKILFNRITAKFNKNRYEQEIFGSLILLKKLSIVRKESPVSADKILEELALSSRLLKPIYEEIIFRRRNGEKDEAFKIFTEEVPGNLAKNFAQILCKIDIINPSELVLQMRVFEESLESFRITRAMKKTSVKSIIGVITSTACIFAILMNFVIVVVFMDMYQMLSGLGV